MKAYGLTGMPGAGKSTVAGLLSEYGVHIVNADELGHELLATDASVVTTIKQAFGSEVTTTDGSIDRSKLAALVFADQTQLALLNSIVHPPLVARLKQTIADLRSIRGKSPPWAVIDAALIAEWGLDRELDGVIYVEADECLRRARLALARGWSETQFLQRQEAQWNEKHKQKVATIRIVNNGDLRSLKGTIKTLVRAVTENP